MHQFHSRENDIINSEEMDVVIESRVRVAECLELHIDDWNTYPCVPSYFLSNYLQQQMYSSIRHIVEYKCRADDHDSDTKGG